MIFVRFKVFFPRVSLLIVQLQFFLKLSVSLCDVIESYVAVRRDDFSL